MARLTKAEINEHLEALAQWRKPRDLLRRADALMDKLGDEDLFTQTGIKFITEAWGAAQFALARRARAVRVLRETWPDFELRTQRGDEAWEFTEVDKPWRKRGDEMKRKAHLRAKGKRRRRSISAANIAKQANQVPTWIRRRCRAKAMKHYAGGGAGLLVYLNWAHFGWQAEVASSFLAATAPAKNAFTEIWLLWNTRVYRTWRAGKAARTSRLAPGTYGAYALR